MKTIHRDVDCEIDSDAHLRSVNALTEKIIGCAIEVHKQLGPGTLESIFENALCLEFDVVGLKISTPSRDSGRI